MLASTRARVLVALAIALVVGALAWPALTSVEPKTVVAYFSRAASLYEGNEVRILGVRVGQVTSVVPDGEAVKVTMEYDAKYSVPADARAVIITATLTSDRFVQLTPVYTSGPKLPDDAEISVDKTGTPIELDRVYGTLERLTVALGPRGANKDGSLNRVIGAADKVLRGNGKAAHDTLLNIAQLADTLGDGSVELFDTISRLGELTDTLAANDDTVSQFIRRLGVVSQQLGSEDQELIAALESLATTVQVAEGFVRDNRKLLVGEVDNLSEVTQTLADYQDVLTEIVTIAPLAAGNLVTTFDPVTQSVSARLVAEDSVIQSDEFLCAMVTNRGLPSSDTLCDLFQVLLGPIFDPPAKQTSSQPPARDVPPDVVREPETMAQTVPELLGAGR